jgi:hypothetical protein
MQLGLSLAPTRCSLRGRKGWGNTNLPGLGSRDMPCHAVHHHHHVTQSSHSINAIGPAPLWSGRKREHCSIMFATSTHIPSLHKKGFSVRYSIGFCLRHLPLPCFSSCLLQLGFSTVANGPMVEHGGIRWPVLCYTGSQFGVIRLNLALHHMSYTLTYGLLWRLRRIVHQIQADYERMIYGGQCMPNIHRFQAKLKYSRIKRMRYYTYMCTCTLANILTYN